MESNPSSPSTQSVLLAHIRIALQLAESVPLGQEEIRQLHLHLLTATILAEALDTENRLGASSHPSRAGSSQGVPLPHVPATPSAPLPTQQGTPVQVGSEGVPSSAGQQSAHFPGSSSPKEQAGSVGAPTPGVSPELHHTGGKPTESTPLQANVGQPLATRGQKAPVVPTRSAGFTQKPVRHEAYQANMPTQNSRKVALESLLKGMSLNDRKLYCAELYGGDGARFRTALAQLESAGSLSQALELLQRDYAGAADSPVLAQFIQLLERRFS